MYTYIYKLGKLFTPPAEKIYKYIYIFFSAGGVNNFPNLTFPPP
jgi:hypothetical protein